MPDLSIFFFNDTATPDIYTLSLHDALPILAVGRRSHRRKRNVVVRRRRYGVRCRSLCRSGPRRDIRLQHAEFCTRSEEHTSELQSRENLVCRLLLEKKKERISSRVQTVSEV